MDGGVTSNKTGSGFFTEISDGDMYTDISNTGFRKKGSVTLMDISDTILVASETAQTIKYEYTNALNSINLSNSHTIYVDNLSNGPNIDDHTISPINELTLTNVHCCGLESVKTFNLDISVNLSNINSQYKFLPAGGKIATCELTNTLNASNYEHQYITIATGSITGNGIYTNKLFDFTNALSFNSSTTTITYTLKAHNLNSDSTIISNTFTTDLICDHASFNNEYGVITTPNCGIFYELSGALD